MKYPDDFVDKIICCDALEVLKCIPSNQIDLIATDPPYFLLNKDWDKQWEDTQEYLAWCKSWFIECHRILKQDGNFYVFQNWQLVAENVVILKSIFPYFRNWITWERIKGRASKSNFKSAKEEILYFSKSDKPKFNEQKKLRPVIAPYRDEEGKPKGWFCYSNDTELLTRSGFKTFDKVTLNDMVFSVDNNLTTKLVKPKKVICYKYKGKMFHIKNKLLDILVTPNHKFIAKHRKADMWKSCLAEDIKNENVIPTIGHYTHMSKNGEHFDLPKIKGEFTTTNGLKCKFNSFIKFLAIFLSEGQFCKYKNSYKLTVYQSKYVNEFRQIFREIGLNFSDNKDKKGMTRFTISNKELYVYLENNFRKNKQKYISEDFIFSLSQDNLKTFLYYFRMGDGSDKTKTVDNKYYNTSKSVIDGIQYALFLINKPSNIFKDDRSEHKNWKDCYTCLEKSKKKMGLNKKHISIVEYDGYVGCVNVDNKNLILRRQGKIFCCGNCDEEGNRVRWTGVGNVWHYTPPVWSSLEEKPEHPTQKPLMMMERIIESSSNEGDVILDPFVGSGSTCVAAKKLKRHYIGIEQDKKYCEIAERRLNEVSK